MSRIRGQKTIVEKPPIQPLGDMRIMESKGKHIFRLFLSLHHPFSPLISPFLQVSSNNWNVKRLRSSRKSDRILTRWRTKDASKRKSPRRSVQTRFKPRSSLLIRRMLRLIGPGKNWKKKRTAKSWLRTSRSKRRHARPLLSRKRSSSRASWNNSEARTMSTWSHSRSKMMTSRT